jgi:RNA ligase (TIGR02306 family)
MAFFAVEKKNISKVWPHSNADRLELASVEGLLLQFAVGKGDYQVGEEVVYFPIDSILPDPLIEFFQIRNFLSGAARHRIKSAKLRGEYSQGFVAKVAKIKEFLGVSELPANLTAALGVTKYEPPILFAGKGANLTPLAGFVGHYDIEGAERFPAIVEMLMDQEVWVSEKVEGTNFGISIDQVGVVRVNQHHHTVTPIEGSEDVHTFIKAVNALQLDTVINNLFKQKFHGKSVTLRGELAGPGIQGNHYKLKDHKVFSFELEVNGHPLPVDEMVGALFGEERVEFAPTIFRGKLRDWLNGKTVQEAANGKSLINPDVLREGIVIKPVTEQIVEWVKTKEDGTQSRERGRLFIKQRSAEYLAKTEN